MIISNTSYLIKIGIGRSMRQVAFLYFCAALSYENFIRSLIYYGFVDKHIKAKISCGKEIN